MELLGGRAWPVDIGNYGCFLKAIFASGSELYLLCPVHHYVNKLPPHAAPTKNRVSLATLTFKQCLIEISKVLKQ